MNAPTSPHTIRILLVEDHPFQLIGLEKQLNRMGFFNLASALDIEDALKLMNAGRRFDFLLCDQNLPDGLGTELIEKAYRIGAIRQAILFSGIDADGELTSLHQEALEKGVPVLACMAKPLNPEKLSLILNSDQ